MSLQSCPVCGYAVSTTTFKCRHCNAAQDEHSASHAIAWFNKYSNKIFGILLMAIPAGFFVYLVLHFHKGGAF